MRTREIVLERTYFMNSVNGSLFIDGDYVCKTIELPWKGNEFQVSCIPEGRYAVEARYSPKFGWHWILLNVPSRSLILIHPANNALKELMGCIAPVSVLTGQGLGSSSKQAMTRIYNSLSRPGTKNTKIYITIKNKDDKRPYLF